MVEPYESGLLEVPDGQVLYWESVGNPAGTAVVYLHGGPGSGGTPGVRRFFDPKVFRAVLFDQRGCGRSRPLADDPGSDLAVNTTAHLVADIERLREHLGIERWVVAGVSWGVTLGLVYAQAHPDRVIGMALGAITSGSGREVEWITRDMGRVFPREWERFVEPVPAAERGGNLAAAYARLLAHPDSAVRERAALRWCEWEDTHVSWSRGGHRRPAFGIRCSGWCSHVWSLTIGATTTSSHRISFATEWVCWPAFRRCSCTAGTTCPVLSSLRGSCLVGGREVGSSSSRMPGTAAAASPGSSSRRSTPSHPRREDDDRDRPGS